MGQSGALIHSLVATHGRPPNLLTWSAGEASALELAAQTDAHDFWYSGLVCLGEVCQGIQRGSYAWSTVKSYYASFYLTRAFLYFTGTAIEYVDPGNGKFKHYVWECVPGASPKSIAGNTHDAVLKYADTSGVIPPFRGQLIGAVAAWKWLMEQRNSANYGVSRFPDPEPTACMARMGADVRRYLVSYFQDTNLLYAFDPDHAIVAYPIALASTLAAVEVTDFSEVDQAHLDRLFRDGAGPMAFARPLYVKS